MPATARHHISLSTVGGTAVGLMLLHDKSGGPIWTVSHYRTIPGRTMSDLEYGFAALPPEIAQTWAETRWEHGIGGIDRNDNSSTNGRYFVATGYKLDYSERGKVKPARNFPASTVDANPTQYVPSGFVKSGARMEAFIGDYPYTWDFTNKNWDRGTQAAGTTGPRMFRNGVEIFGSVYVPSWADDVGTTDPEPDIAPTADLPCRYIYKTLTATSWTQKAASATHPEYFKFFTTANSKLIGGYIGDIADSGITCDGVDATATNFTYTGADVLAIGDVIQVEDEMMVVWSVSAPTNTIQVVRGYRGTVGAVHAALTTIYDVTLNKHHIRTSTDGTTWSAATTIGDSTSPITGMIGVDWDAASYLYIFKTDGVYNYDFTNVNKVYDAGGPTNGRANCLWNGYVYFSKSGGGLLRLDPDTDNITDVSFSIVMPQQTQLHGEVVALQATPDALYALVVDTGSTKYHLLEGRMVDGNVNISWQHVGAITYTTGTDQNHAALGWDTVPNGSAARDRIWAGVESTGSNLLPYMYLRPSDQDMVLNDDDDSYEETIDQDSGMSSVTKLWRTVKFTTAQMTVTGTPANDNYMEAQYSADGAAYAYFASSLGGTASQAASKITGSNTTLYFPAGTDAKRCIVKRLYYQGANKTTTGPELLDMNVTAALRQDAVVSIPLYLDVRDGLRLLNGTYEYNASGLMTQIRTWKDQADELAMVDYEGTSRRVILAKDTYQERLVGTTATGRYSYVVKCLAIVLA